MEVDIRKGAKGTGEPVPFAVCGRVAGMGKAE